MQTGGSSETFIPRTEGGGSSERSTIDLHAFQVSSDLQANIFCFLNFYCIPRRCRSLYPSFSTSVVKFFYSSCLSGTTCRKSFAGCGGLRIQGYARLRVIDGWVLGICALTFETTHPAVTPQNTYPSFGPGPTPRFGAINGPRTFGARNDGYSR